MAGFFMGEEAQERMDLWLTRALVLLSFLAHLTLALFAGIRRRRDAGVRRSLVWLAYHVTEIGTPIALGKVFLDNTTADSEQQLLVAYREQQMFAFWAPFLLLHLGRPDNITSYDLENKELSPTQKAGLVLEIGGAIYGSYKQRFMRGDGALRAAFFIMLFFGSYKYVERAVALHRASFANIRSSNQRKMLPHFTVEDEGRKQDDALLDAHRLLGVTMGAFAQYKVNPGDYLWRSHFPDWKYVIKVVEKEASLMYDILYTKASVIHTWGGYIIRFLSPLATFTALYLFHSKDGQALESADRMVTYILLVGTLGLDVRCLEGALESTWTDAFWLNMEEGYEKREDDSLLRREVERRIREQQCLLAESPWLHPLKQAGWRAGRQSWYWLHRRLFSLHPSRLLLTRSGPSGHRLLPGSGVGQRSLLHECSSCPQGRLEKMISFFAELRKKKIDVKDELLEVMCTHLVLGPDKMVRWKEVDDYMRSNAKNYSFESNLIALHVATDIFLLCKPATPGIESKASGRYEKQIQALSDYMMFLLTQRQHMVLPPGDKASDHKKACRDLEEIWRERGTSGSQTTREAELANILLKLNAKKKFHRRSFLTCRNDTLAVGADWALKLLQELEPASYGSGQHLRSRAQFRLEAFILVFTEEAQTKIKEHRDRGERSELLDYMLRLICLSWVRLLSWTSDQCSRESHAKQLSCGGELLTIAWLMKQHKTIFSWPTY